MRRGACALVAGGAALLGGCTLITDSFLTNEFSGDPFPIAVDTTSGAILVGMRQAGAEDRTAVLDLLSPITVVDPGTTSEPSLSFADLTLLGRGASGALDLPRARFPDAQLVALHPCAPDDSNQPIADCMVGPPDMQHVFKGIIGADALAGDAVRLRLGDDQIFLLADIGGPDRGRSLSCDAVFDSPYRGGGTLVFPTTELPFGNRRITLQACLGPGTDPDPSAPPDLTTLRQAGADALFVVSTSIGVSILDESAYARYRVAYPMAPALIDLPLDSVMLPSGRVAGRRASINALALVATSTSNALAPCRQVYAHRLLTLHTPVESECATPGTVETGKLDCPCENGSLFCAVPAVVELTPPAGIDVLIVSDDDPTLQSLRTELRPDQPEVDGLLGTGVLRAAEIDVDYPHDRLLARCTTAGCLVRPELAQASDRQQICGCLGGPASYCATRPRG
jgi:hypothetical protein